MTLIEIIMVLAIVGVMMSVAIPNILAARQAYQIQTAGFNIVNRVGEARMEALRRNRQVVAVLDPATRSMRVVIVNPGPVDVPIAEPEYLPANVNFDGGGTPNLRITFDSLGRPLNPPQQLMLRHSQTQARRIITIQPTGRLTVTQ
jgi:type II secretory pathway pseudopilin PulG